MLRVLSVLGKQSAGIFIHAKGSFMATITEIMRNNHRECDDLFVRAEGAVDAGDWSGAVSSWAAFATELEHHITAQEEGRLFPAFEKSGGPSGPTYMMRSEHDEMRALVKQIQQALDSRDADSFLGLADTMMILMQQHNMKEEQILYPMMDQFIPGFLG